MLKKIRYLTPLRTILSLAVLFVLSACSPMKTVLENRHLQTSTKMSDSIFLDPVSPKEKTIYVQIKNTSDQQSLHLNKEVRHRLASKGYQIVKDPERAHYLLQANVLKLSRMDKKRAEDIVTNGYGSAITGGALGALAGAATNSNSAPYVGGVAGSVVGMVASSAIKDINYTMITDVQVSERPAKGEHLSKRGHSKLKQGNSGQETIESHGGAHWKRYRTRIVSNAEKMNLKFVQAKPQLEKQLAGSIAGLF